MHGKQIEKNREIITGEKAPSILDMTNSQLTHWLSRFVLEAHKRDGSEYPPNTLHHICAGIMRTNGRIVDFFKGDDFMGLQATLDGECNIWCLVVFLLVF